MPGRQPCCSSTCFNFIFDRLQTFNERLGALQRLLLHLRQAPWGAQHSPEQFVWQRLRGPSWLVGNQLLATEPLQQSRPPLAALQPERSSGKGALVWRQLFNFRDLGSGRTNSVPAASCLEGGNVPDRPALEADQAVEPVLAAREAAKQGFLGESNSRPVSRAQRCLSLEHPAQDAAVLNRINSPDWVLHEPSELSLSALPPHSASQPLRAESELSNPDPHCDLACLGTARPTPPPEQARASTATPIPAARFGGFDLPVYSPEVGDCCSKGREAEPDPAQSIAEAGKDTQAPASASSSPVPRASQDTLQNQGTARRSGRQGSSAVDRAVLAPQLSEALTHTRRSRTLPSAAVEGFAVEHQQPAESIRQRQPAGGVRSDVSHRVGPGSLSALQHSSAAVARHHQAVKLKQHAHRSTAASGGASVPGIRAAESSGPLQQQPTVLREVADAFRIEAPSHPAQLCTRDWRQRVSAPEVCPPALVTLARGHAL